MEAVHRASPAAQQGGSGLLQVHESHHSIPELQSLPGQSSPCFVQHHSWFQPGAAPGGPSGANLVADLLLRSEGARFSFGVIFCGSISPKRLCGFRSCAQHSVNLQLSSNPDLSCCLLQPGIASLSAQDKFLLVSMETQDLQQVWLLLLIKRKRMKGGEKIKP